MKTEFKRFVRPVPARRTQQGAVLFIAMAMLIILTLLGLSAAQVTVLQERMASIYRSDHQAFANVDGLLASRERDTRGNTATTNLLCDNFYNGSRQVAAWQSGQSLTTATEVENLGRGATFISLLGSLEAGLAQEIGDKNCLFLQVSAHAYDNPVSETAHAIVQSIFTP